jgi:hypothetical protein
MAAALFRLSKGRFLPLTTVFTPSFSLPADGFVFSAAAISSALAPAAWTSLSVFFAKASLCLSSLRWQNGSLPIQGALGISSACHASAFDSASGANRSLRAFQCFCSARAAAVCFDPTAPPRISLPRKLHRFPSRSPRPFSLPSLGLESTVQVPRLCRAPFTQLLAPVPSPFALPSPMKLLL